MSRNRLHLVPFLFLFSLHAEASSFKEVWDVVKTPGDKNLVYQSTLPQRKHSLKAMLTSPLTIIEASKRAIADPTDLFEQNTEKLIRGNGICLAGKWVMTQESPYTGYFKIGAEALIIVRASVGFDNTTRKGLRSFGMAGKIFPTLDEKASVETANFFLIDDNMGTMQTHYVDAPLLTKAKVTIGNLFINVFRELSVRFIRVLITVQKAQKKADIHSDVRQLYPLSQVSQDGMIPNEKSKTPALLKIIGNSSNKRIVADDFRDELKQAIPLKFDVYAAEEESRKPLWSKEPIGYILLTEAIVSDACDQRLRFAHPIWKSGIN